MQVQRRYAGLICIDILFFSLLKFPDDGVVGIPRNHPNEVGCAPGKKPNENVKYVPTTNMDSFQLQLVVYLENGCRRDVIIVYHSIRSSYKILRVKPLRLLTMEK